MIEVYLLPNVVRLNVADGSVRYDFCTALESIQKDDFITLNCNEYREKVGDHLKKWQGFECKYPLPFYERGVVLLKPYFLLIDELERQLIAQVLDEIKHPVSVS